MSQRPIRVKQANRYRRGVRKRQAQHDLKLDLVDFLQTRRHASTAGSARKLLTEGKVRVGSHIVGREEVTYKKANGETETVWEPRPLVPVSFKSEIVVIS